MRTEIIEKYIYSYEEVPEEYKEKADGLVKEAYDRDLDCDLEYYMKDFMVCSIQGLFPFILYPEISYDFGYSQGSGASFTCDFEYSTMIVAYMEDKNIHLSSWCVDIVCNNIKAQIKRNSHHYCHENTVYADVTWCNMGKAKPLFEDFILGLEDWLEEVKDKVCGMLYDYGTEQIEWIWKEENLKECAQSYEFHLLEEKLTIKYKED